jgi:hypothetical protein
MKHLFSLKKGKQNLGSKIHHTIIITNITVNKWLNDCRGIQGSMLKGEA